jgi:hypothetical protein
MPLVVDEEDWKIDWDLAKVSKAIYTGINITAIKGGVTLMTPLMWCAVNGHFPQIQGLITRGVDPRTLHSTQRITASGLCQADHGDIASYLRAQEDIATAEEQREKDEAIYRQKIEQQQMSKEESKVKEFNAKYQEFLLAKRKLSFEQLIDLFANCNFEPLPPAQLAILDDVIQDAANYLPLLQKVDPAEYIKQQKLLLNTFAHVTSLRHL